MKHDIPLLHNNTEIYIIHVEIILSQNMQNNSSINEMRYFSNQRFNLSRINMRRLMNKT